MLVPAIVDPRFIVRNQLMTTTDNDDKLYSPYESQILSRYKYGAHRLCTCHGITQVWPKNKITSLRIEKGASLIGHPVLEPIKRIPVSWTNDVQSKEELDMPYDCLKALLHLEEFMKCFDASFPHDVHEAVESKIWIHREKLAHYR